MAERATITTTVSIDVSPDGVKFTINSLDSDVAELIALALDYKAEPSVSSSYSMSSVVIKSVKALQFVTREDVLPEEVDGGDF